MKDTKKIQTEYEATFLDINKEKIRTRLKEIGAKLVYPEFLQKRVAFRLPAGHEIEGGFLRVRKECDKNTMSLKIISGDKIADQKEIFLKIDDFDKGVIFLESIGCTQKAFQETKRELWVVGEVEVTIDEWPFLEPYIEVEGKSEEAVKKVSEELGFDYSKAFFGSAATIIGKKYGISEDLINNHTPLIVFGGENPYLIHQKSEK